MDLLWYVFSVLYEQVFHQLRRAIVSLILTLLKFSPVLMLIISQFRDLIEILEPALRMRTSSFLASMNKSKVLARVIKKQRTPEWPTVPTKDLPSKPLCDQLLAGYLRTMESVYRVLHIPSFQKDYEDLWQNPTGSSTSFMMLLKLVLTIGATIHDDKFSLRVEATRWVYEAQTWLSSPDFKSRLGVQYLQIGILLLLARQFINVGSELVWITAGSLFRTAVYIGLHRDPSQLPKMTTFQAEMRRRLWNTILEMSLQTSLESGGPCFFSLTDFNTAPPGNFDDEQLATANAIAMPNHVFTQTSVAIMFRETLPARLAVAKFLNDMGSTGTYEETLRLDTELRAAYKTFRRALQTFQGLSAPLAPRFDTQAVDFIIQRYICCLHVPFFGASLKDPVFAFSRKAVIESSTKIWALAHPVPTSSISNSTFEMSRSEDDSMAQTDLARLCVCGGGFFRTFAFHSSTFLGVELRALVQEEEEDMSSITRPTSLLSTIQDAANWYLHCIEAGETGIKGYLLLQLLATQIDATAKRVEQAELQGLLLQAGEEAMNTCLNILETIAGQESGTNESGENQDFGLQNNLDFMEDWDLMMSDVFDIGDVTLIDNFLT